MDVPEQISGGVQVPGPARPAAGEEGGVETRLGVVLPWLDEALHLVDDVPASQGRVVLHGTYPGDQGLVDVGLQFGCVCDQTVQTSADKGEDYSHLQFGGAGIAQWLEHRTRD